VIRVLTFSTLYPSAVTPSHGIFVETRLRHLIRSGQVEARVVAPVPWFPLKHRLFERYARLAAIPHKEVLHGVQVSHPRYALIPKFGMSSAPFSLALSSLRTIRRIQEDGFDFDVIDAHYYYPDGVAAALIARKLRKPLVITARGTDLNLVPKYFIPRKLIQWAGEQADFSISVCKALQDEMARLGMNRERLVVLRNGVDLERFVPIDRRVARQHLGLPDVPTFVSVGHLVERKGHEVAIQTLAASFPQAALVIVGEGELRTQLERMTRQLGVSHRVTFAGAVPQERLKYYFSAADVSILASSREGWPNVLLESMACGTPVVATRQWGTPEVVSAPEAGVLVDERTSESVAAGIRALLARNPSREATRAYAERFSWDETTQGQLRLFDSIARRRAARVRAETQSAIGDASSAPLHARKQDRA
jgi:glycosyltransferase involved in cell wall biosynthesis